MHKKWPAENEGILGALEMNRCAWGVTDRCTDMHTHTHFSIDLLLLHLLFIAGMSMTHTCVHTALLSPKKSHAATAKSRGTTHTFSLRYIVFAQ